MPVEVADSQTASPEGPAGDGPEAAAGAAERTEQALQVCPRCASDLVFPIGWAPAGRESWSVELRCPGCEWIGGGVYDQDTVDRFDRALDAGTEQLLGDLNLLARANMEEQVRRFVAALDADHILPEDF
jgi:hypothetical protein